MRRVDLEHVLRAASAITNERDFIVIGSQAILGQFPDAPDELLVSAEVDIYPRDAIRRGLVDRTLLLERIEGLPVDEERRHRLRGDVTFDFASAQK